MTTETLSRNVLQAVFSVQIPGGEYITRKLKEGEAVSVGSGSNAELRLESPGVAALHCLMTLEEGRVNIKDCYSPAGTYVDDQRIQETRVDYDCTIRLGESEIAIKIQGGKPRRQETTVSTFKPLPIEPAKPAIAVPQQAEKVPSVLESFEEEVVSSPSEGLVSSLMLELEQAQIENTILKERLKRLPSQSFSQTSDPFQMEMIELMREEIVALQEELERRNTRDSCANFDNLTDDVLEIPPREEVEKLVDRLEELLDELHQKDESIQVLQNLVLAAESANQAEQEEREQLAQWLGEFEQRFELMSGEWKAENEQLKHKLNLLEEERTATQTALAADTGSAKTEALQRIISSLREQYLESQNALEKIKELNTQLKIDADEARHSSPREEEIRLSRERAEIARMRHELEVRMQKLHHLSEEATEPSAEALQVDQKLRDITDQLRSTVKKQPTSSLSSRLLNLWGRLS